MFQLMMLTNFILKVVLVLRGEIYKIKLFKGIYWPGLVLSVLDLVNFTVLALPDFFYLSISTTEKLISDFNHLSN